MTTQINKLLDDIILHHVAIQDDWKLFVKGWLPLFNSSGRVENGLKVYSSLVKSSCCLKCLQYVEKANPPPVIKRCPMHILHDINTLVIIVKFAWNKSLAKFGYPTK